LGQVSIRKKKFKGKGKFAKKCFGNESKREFGRLNTGSGSGLVPSSRKKSAVEKNIPNGQKKEEKKRPVSQTTKKGGRRKEKVSKTDNKNKRPKRRGSLGRNGRNRKKKGNHDWGWGGIPAKAKEKTPEGTFKKPETISQAGKAVKWSVCCSGMGSGSPYQTVLSFKNPATQLKHIVGKEKKRKKNSMPGLGCSSKKSGALGRTPARKTNC